MFKIMSVCSGVNGFDLSLDPRKFKTVGFSEIDKYASSVLKYNYPTIKNYGDMTHARFTKTLPDFDILTGGTPCQSFSIAGTREGLEGKSGLFFSYVKILKERQPSYFIWENVENVTSINNGRDFTIIQSMLAEVGYDLQWQVLNSSAFGVPQRRKRLFIVGNLRGKPIKQVRFIKGSRAVVRPKGIDYLERHGIRKDRSIFIAYSRSTRQNHIDHRARIEDDANTLTTGDGCGSLSSGNFVVKPDGSLRRITPVEAERLMLWPDDFTKYGINKKGERYQVSDTQRYKLIGNGIVSIIPQQLMEACFL